MVAGADAFVPKSRIANDLLGTVLAFFPQAESESESRGAAAA